ncbi:pirin family protein [Acidomonas methanolica]|uniref:pirin family protein n=1 Tax=Acidomonas methanolica TaxID=437 RepID=UPI002119D95A|nr:pirin family protein [Acidomonas methanolica]MCQ9155151.1 pirin family protein [Acidomonas methanolica]
MIEIRRFETLGHADHGWLNARHHFSFADYHDPRRVHWGRLRVWNDDEIAPDTGFGAHPHRDMEIVTYVRKGAITHQDSLGNQGRTEAGDVQVMSAGTGIVHSEYNREAETTTLFQIWLLPDRRGDTPRWDSRRFPADDRANRLTVLASGDPEDREALPIRSDAKIAAGALKAGETVTYKLGRDRLAYVVPASGAIEIEGHRLNARDGGAISDTETLSIRALSDSEILLVDSAPL